MKTLNLNKLTILLGLFLVSAFFTTGANAGCVVNAAGEIITDYTDTSGDNNENFAVTDTIADDDFDALAQRDSCNITPTEYKLVFYKYGICKADPSLGDISSCAFLFEDAAGIEHDIELGVTESLPIPEFAIDAGIYPFSYVLLSNELGMKWSGTMSVSTTGNTAGGTAGDGKSCWTSGRGPTSTALNSGGDVVTTVHGAAIADDLITLQCAGTMGTPLFNYEVLSRFSEGYCEDALAASGDLQTFELEGTGQGAGIPTVSLLTTADVFATTCQNAAKIAWTTNLTTPLTITEDSTFAMMMLATDSNTLLFNNGANNDLYKIESGAPRIMLVVN